MTLLQDLVTSELGIEKFKSAMHREKPLKPQLAWIPVFNRRETTSSPQFPFSRLYSSTVSEATSNLSVKKNGCFPPTINTVADAATAVDFNHCSSPFPAYV